VPGDVDQVAFVDIFASAQPGPPHAASVEIVGEGSLDDFCPSSHRPVCRPPTPSGCGWHRPLHALRHRRASVKSPAAWARRCASSTPRRRGSSRRRASDTFVRHEFARLLVCRRGANLRQVLLCRRQRALDRRCVALVGGMQRRRDDDAGVEIDRMLGLCMPGACDRPSAWRSCIRIGLAGHFRRRFLPLRARSVRTRSSALGRLDAAFLGHLDQHFAIAPAIVPAHDRAQRPLGLHRRSVDADPLASDQAFLGHQLQHPANTVS